MANLLGANIGTNYKGFLNLDSTINTPLDATLRAVTDGMGTASTLQLSTTKVAIGTILYFNGITSSFPSIKRNAAAIDFRLADDSGFCNISAAAVVCSSTGLSNGSRNISYNDVYSGLEYQAFGGHTFKVYNGSTYVEVMRVIGNSATPSLVIGASSGLASARLQVDSTTQGFLPPRMTTAQKNAIATPAAGLVVYDTTLNKLAVFTTAWETVTSV